MRLYKTSYNELYPKTLESIIGKAEPAMIGEAIFKDGKHPDLERTCVQRIYRSNLLTENSREFLPDTTKPKQTMTFEAGYLTGLVGGRWCRL